MSLKTYFAVVVGIALLVSGCTTSIAAIPEASTAMVETEEPILPTATIEPARSWNATRTPGPGFSPEPDAEAAGPLQDGTPMMDFVSDVTLPDGTIVQPGELLLKIWRVENTGDTVWETEWPPFQLTFNAGDQLSGPSIAQALFYPPGADLSFESGFQAWSGNATSVAPGEQMDLPLLLRAPDTAGHYRGYWTLSTGEGEDLGDLYLDIVVEEDGTPQGSWSGAWTQQDPYVTSRCPGPLNLVQDGMQVGGFGYACDGRLLLVAGAVTEPGVVEGSYGLAGFVFPFNWVMLPGGNQFQGQYWDSAYTVGAWCGGRDGVEPPFEACMPAE